MVFALYIAFFVGIKIYIAWGLRQVFVENKYLALVYFVFSVICLILGMITLNTAFEKNNFFMSFWSNFSLALMVSVFICEAILGVFFIFDDLIRLIQWAMAKFSANSIEEITTSGGRRRLIKTIGLGFTTLPFAGFLYGITKGKYAYKVYKQTLVFDDLPKAFDGFKIVQFSDLHAGSFDSADAIKRGVETMQNLNADMILFTGDLVNDYEEEIVPYKEIFKNLTAPYGKHSVLGNHDYPLHRRRFDDEAHGQKNLAALKQHHLDMDFNLLLNENTLIEKDGESIRLVGTENWGKSRYFGKMGNLNKAAENCNSDEFTVLMTHDPSHWEVKVKEHPKHFHLTLCGHTHGCQMGLELPNFKWSPAKYVFKHWAGLYEEKGQFLYVNRGFGFLGFAGRVGIPPEITEITLKRSVV